MEKFTETERKLFTGPEFRSYHIEGSVIRTVHGKSGISWTIRKERNGYSVSSGRNSPVHVGSVTECLQRILGTTD